MNLISNAFAAATCLLIGIGGCSPTVDEPTVEAPVEHIIYDGDQGVIDVSPPDTLSVRIPGADASDEEYYTEYCADMGGTFTVRLLPGDDPDEEAEPEVVCEDVDF